MHPIHWKVVYKDESTLEEYDGDVFHYWKEIDLEQIRLFSIVNNDGEAIATLNCTTDWLSTKDNQLYAISELGETAVQPVWFKRITQTMNVTSELESEHIIYVLGARTTIDGTNYQRLYWFDELGNLTGVSENK